MSIHLFTISMSRYAVIWLLVLCSFSVHAGINTINTLAGNGTAGSSGDGGLATGALLNNPYGVAVDISGNSYITDYSDSRVRKITVADGTINTVAGTGTVGYSGDGGAATNALLKHPSGIAVDISGNLYITDNHGHCIRKITTGGIISTVAGNGIDGSGGDGGLATNAQLSYPNGVAVDISGNLYIADSNNHRIRKVTVADGKINTVVGTTQGSSGDGGLATSAKLNLPTGVAVDNSGNLYIADYNNHRVRKVTVADGKINTVAGTGAAGSSGDGGAATSALLYLPSGIAVDSSGNLYIADGGNHRLRKITVADGKINTLVGTAQGYSGDGGAATSALLNNPIGVAIDSSGNLYIADYWNHRLRKVTVAPIMNVQGNSISIVSGDTTPTTTDNTDFGSTPVNTPVSQTFTILNTGDGALNLSGSPIVSVTGSGFSVMTQPTSPVAATTGTANFVIQFLPTASGVSNGTVSIANDDSSNNPYTFSITATGSALNQTISFTPPASGMYGGTASLTATATSSLAVSFTSATTSVCTISGTTVSYVGTGTCTVNANQAGDSTYNAAPQVSGNITVSNPAPTYPLTNSTPASGQTIQFDTLVGQKQTKSITLKNFGSAALIFNSINTPIAPFSYPKPMPFSFIPTGDPTGSAKTLELSCTPTEMGLKTMMLQMTTNDVDNTPLVYSLECMGRLPVVVSSVANNGAINFGNALINSTLSQSINFSESGNTDLVLLSASITGTNAANFAITAPTTFPTTVADGATSSQILTVTCTPKTATPLTATLQIATNDPVNAILNYPLQCGGLFSLVLNTTGQGTISGCGSSCVQNHQQDAVVNLSAVPATGWQLGSWSGDCANGQVVMTGNKSCGATFTQIVENPTTPGGTTGTIMPPTGTTTNTITPSTPTIPTGTTESSTTTTPPTDTTPGNINTSNPLSPPRWHKQFGCF